MDIATIIGLAITGGCITWSIWLGGSFMIFVDIPSVVMVCGGLVGVVFTRFPMETVKLVVKYNMKAFFFAKSDPKETIAEIIKMAEIARRESVFALEKVPVEDPFLKKAMTLAADNRPPEVISSILQMEIDAMGERHGLGMTMLDAIAESGPALGMIGTLVGLVQMLQNLSDPSSIGPAMAVAILTTFYGAVIANVWTLPFRMKLAIRSKQEIAKMGIIIAGTLGIVAGENPRLIREKLNAFLPPADRTSADGGDLN